MEAKCYTSILNFYSSDQWLLFLTQYNDCCKFLIKKFKVNICFKLVNIKIITLFLITYIKRYKLDLKINMNKKKLDLIKLSKYKNVELTKILVRTN